MNKKQPKQVTTLKRYLKLEISKQKELQDIVNTAAEICQTTCAMITVVDDDTQYIKFKIGCDIERTPRNDSFCSHALEQHDFMIVTDAYENEHFRDNVMVTGPPYIRFYAGIPLTTQDGYNLGILCVIDQEPKILSNSQLQLLRILSKQIINLLEFESSLRILKEQFIKAKDSEIKLRSFYESSISCHMLVGKQMEILDFNRQLALFVERIYHISVSVGMKVTDILHEMYVEGFITNFKNALSGLTVYTERKVKNDDEWWYITYEPAYDADGKIIGVSYNAIDISKRVEHELKVEEQSQVLRKIAQIQSHELRRPVASIKGLMNIFKSADYYTTKDELLMLERAVNELDEKIRMIVDYTVESHA